MSIKVTVGNGAFFRPGKGFGRISTRKSGLENAGIHGIQIRHRAICIHLDHPRSYICKNAIKRNIEIRKTNKTKKIIRTKYGIKKNFSDSQ